MESDEYEFKQIDLDDPDDAREFLSSLIFNGKPVSKFQTSSGRKLSVKDMTDEEACAFAQQMHQELFDGSEHVDTRVNKTIN